MSQSNPTHVDRFDRPLGASALSPRRRPTPSTYARSLSPFGHTLPPNNNRTPLTSEHPGRKYAWAPPRAATSSSRPFMAAPCVRLCGCGGGVGDGLSRAAAEAAGERAPQQHTQQPATRRCRVWGRVTHRRHGPPPPPDPRRPALESTLDSIAGLGCLAAGVVVHKQQQDSWQGTS